MIERRPLKAEALFPGCLDAEAVVIIMIWLQERCPRSKRSAGMPLEYKRTIIFLDMILVWSRHLSNKFTLMMNSCSLMAAPPNSGGIQSMRTPKRTPFAPLKFSVRIDAIAGTFRTVGRFWWNQRSFFVFVDSYGWWPSQCILDDSCCDKGEISVRIMTPR